MVIDDHERESGTTSRDRGQLILIGALALAFILLGVVVVYNGVLFTETISSSSTGQSVSHAEVADEEVEQGIQGVIQRENVAENYSDDELEETIDSYDTDYLNATTEGRPTITNVSFGSVKSRANVTIEEFPESAQSLGEPNNQSVGHFVLNVDTDLDEKVTVQNESDEIVSIDPNQDWTLEDRNQETCDITPEADQDTVRIDLLTPAVNASNDCETPFITRSDEFENLTIEGNASGTYELVFKDDDGDGAWTVTISYAYESNDVTVEKEREIDVYGDRP